MTLHSWEFGDPEIVAIKRQEERERKERACGLCIHKRSINWKGREVMFCEYKRREYGQRCDLYRVNKNA